MKKMFASILRRKNYGHPGRHQPATVLISVIFCLFCTSLFAVTPVPYTEGVSFSFRISGVGNGIMTVYGEGTAALGHTTYNATTESGTGLAWFRPGKKYTVNFQASGPYEFWLGYIAPAGYELLVNGVSSDLTYQSGVGGWYSYDYTVELRPVGRPGSTAAGIFSGIQLGKSVTWDVGLGGLRTGRGAGLISFKEYDLTTNPANRQRLFYAAPSNYVQITSVYDGASAQTLRQVKAPQVLVDIVDLTGDPNAGYTLKFYDPAQGTWNGTLYTLSGSPWRTIKVETPGAGQLKLTETEGAVVRVSFLTLTSGSVASGAYVWTLQEGDGTTWLRTTTDTSTASGGAAATGGTVTTGGGYTIHTFTGAGTLSVTSALTGAQAVIVAGAGGGGHQHAGGGGAGGLLSLSGLSVGTGSYGITVGDGGAGCTWYPYTGNNGGNSSALGYSAIGGGAGTGMDQYGNDGGSGGGDGYPSGGVRGGNGTSGQGNTGSRGSSTSIFNGGGGGGAGGPGVGASGGPALSTWAGTFAGGGGGGYAGGPGGGAGAGAGGSAAAYGGDAAANTGSGGGGGNYDAFGGNGGSGIVVIRYTTAPTYRDETVVVRTGGTSGTIVAQTKYRYENVGGWGEELTKVIADPDTAALTTTYDYYTTSSAYGNYRKVKSITSPTGNWIGYIYYDQWDYRGQVLYELYPYKDSPSTVTFNTTICRVLAYDYAVDWTGRRRIPSVRVEYNNGVITGQVFTTPTLNQTTLGQYYTIYQTDAYASASAYQRSVSEIIDARYGNNPDYNGLVWSVKRPDLSQDSYAHYQGSYNYSTKVFTFAGGSAADYHFRSIVWHGSTSATGATGFNGYEGIPFTLVYLTPDKSTMEVTIRNTAGLVVRTETQVYTGGSSFSLLTGEDFTYDAAGRLTTRVASNGATVTNTFTHGRLTSTLDPTGTETQFTYDLLGRVATTVKKGAAAGTYAAQGDITAINTYDGAGHVTQSVTTGGALSQTATATYDLAGRVTQSVAPGGYTSGFAYASGGKIVTATLPGGATRIDEVYLDGQTKSQTGTAVVASYTGFTVNSTPGTVTRQVNFGTSTSTALVKATTDWLGRLLTEEKPSPTGSGTVTLTLTYNSLGQLAKRTQPGLADTLYTYDTLGQLIREGLDVGANAVLDLASSDRITDRAWTFFTSGSNWWRRDTTSTYATANSGTATQVAKVETQLSGFASNRFALTNTTDIFGNVTSQFTDVDRSGKKVTTSTDAPDSTTDAVQIAYNGLLMSAKDTANLTTTFGYDALGRPVTSVDPRTGTTTTAYVSGTSQVSTVTDPASIVQATYTYDSAGRVSSVKDALNKYAYTSYTTRSEVYRQWGDTTNPVEYAYDTYGRRTTMSTYRSGTGWTASTWPASPGTADTTTWAYQAATGLLSSKTDAAGKAVAYTYTQAGQLATRQWARIVSGSTKVTTTYAYSTTTRELTGVTYNDGVSFNVTYAYNRLGQFSTVTDRAGPHDFVYNLAGTLELQSETFSNGVFGTGRRFTHTYATSGVLGRPAGFGLGTSANPTADQSVVYGYAADGRLNSVAAGGQTFAYGYTANSHLVGTVTNSALNSTDTRTYDATHNWIDQRKTTWGATPVIKTQFDFTQDNLGRVTQTAKTGEVFNRYGNGTEGLTTYYTYDDRSQVTSEVTKVGTSSTVLTGRNDSAFAYDPIGNRTTVTHNGNSATYTANSLNQYTQRTVPGYFDVAGADTATTVTVAKSGGPTDTATRHGNYFFDAYGLTNTSAPIFSTLTITGSGTATLPAYVEKTPQALTYDDDGNLTSDGRWNFTYDGENRPITAETTAAAVTAGVTRQKLTLGYDHLGRRIVKGRESGWNGSAYTVYDFWNRYLYHGWNVVAQVDGNSGALPITANYFWGLDLSGSLGGAGGVGGLLMVQEGGNSYLPAYDALGNVHAMIKASSGSIDAAYEYDAFGNTLRESGTYAASNPFRFATKYADVETGLIQYNTRYYSPSLGRFINRDSIGEQGGLNLYAYCGNNAVNKWDYLGMWRSFGGRAPHQSSNDRILSNYFPAAGVRLVNNRTQFYDSSQFQTLDTSFRHGMLSPGQSQADGREMVDSFVREQMAQARLLRMLGLQDESLDAFTAALHTLQDLTSPSHTSLDGQLLTWRGTAGPVNKLLGVQHVAGEFYDPGAGSELDRATRFAADWLTAGQVPLGNVVDALMVTLGRSTANEALQPLGETITLDKFVVTGVRGAGPSSNSGFGQSGVVVLDKIVVNDTRPSDTATPWFQGDGAAASRVADMLLRVGPLSDDARTSNSGWKRAMAQGQIDRATAVWGAGSGMEGLARLSAARINADLDAMAMSQSVKAGKRL